jgi:undecaprenyl-diphosphatase
MTVANTMLSYISHRDHTLMRRVNRWHAPRWIRVWMLCATRGGDGWLWYAMGLVVLLTGGGRRFLAVGTAGLASALGIAIFLRLKKATGRQRPCAIEPHCWATLLPPDQFSFPSGHTITAFAVGVVLSSYYPELATGLLFCALSIAASRILLGMHFLSDVLAGAAIGTLVACGSVWAVHLLA